MKRKITASPTSPMFKHINLLLSKAQTALLTFMLLLSLSEQAHAQAGAALNFDGTNDYVDIGSQSSLSATTTFTVEAWVKRTAGSYIYPIFFSKSVNADWSANSINFGAWNNGAGVYARIAGSGDAYGYNAGSMLPADTWTHVAVVYDGSGANNAARLKIYINGSPISLIFAGTIPAITATISANATLGVASGSPHYWKGGIDEVRVWNRALCQGEIQNNMSCELGGSQTGLQSLYHFNQGVGEGSNGSETTLNDASGNSNNGTLTNFGLSGTTSNWISTGGVTTGTACAAYLAPEINLKGNGNNILDGTTTTSTTTDTDFGTIAANTSLAKTYTIENTGSGNLTISSITSSNTKFVVSNAPTSVAGNSTATFTVTFSPTAAGVQNGTITVNNTDCDEAVYDFAVIGTSYVSYTFNGTTNTDWATATNWSTGVAPTTALLASGDAVVIAANCVMNDVTISFPSGTNFTVNSSRTLSPSQNTYITIASGATLTLNTAASMSQGRITNTGTMDIYGSYSAFHITNNSGGVMNIKTGGTYSCDACSQAFNAGGIVNNDGNLIIPGGGGNAGTINNNSGGVIGSSGGTQMSNSGTIVNAGSFISRNASTTGIFTNSGTLTVGSSSELFTIGGGTFTNSGTVNIPAGNTLYVNSGSTLTNNGIVNNNATMSVNGTFTNNGTYKGSGTYSGSLFTNPSGGIVAPGNSAGCMTFSNGFTNAGSLQLEINSATACTGYDRITVTGTATLGGTLDLTFGYAGSGADKATVIAATTLSGVFAAVNNIAPNWFYNTNAPATGQVTMSYNAVLPIELLNFKATPSVSIVTLRWETANEMNNKGFQIERSPQPPKGAFQTWEVLGFVNAKGKAATYEFVDKSPLGGLGAYRLRQIDNDGKETLSKVVSVSNNKTTKLKVYPSVTSGFLTVETSTQGDFQIITLLGQHIIRGSLTPQIDVSTLPAGTYMIRFGEEQAKFVKQ